MRKLLILLVSALWLFAFVEIDDSAPQILPADKAFQPSVYVKDTNVVVDIKLAEKIYIYKKDLHLFQIEPRKKEIRLKLPKPILLHGDEVFEKRLLAKADLKQFDGSDVKVELQFQGCSELGICYPPQKKTFLLHLPKNLSNQEQKIQTNSSEEEQIVSILKDQNIFIILGSFFLFGLLLSFTPCVFPMIPILSSLIVGAKNMNTKRAFFYSLVYVLAMALTYTVAGVLAGLFGSNLQAALQNPFVITLFALIFVALALSMFGFYEIGLPASIQTMIAKKSDEAGSKGGVIGVAIMGFLSALIVGPCVAPPLAGALIYIGQSGDALLGGAALFVMSLGMGLPLLLIGTGAGKFMPKPGGWMRAINNVFGVVMLGVAIWMLDRIVPESLTMLLWSMLFIFSAVYLRAFEQIGLDAHWFVYFKKGLGLIFFLYGVALFVGALSGATNPLKPLAGLQQQKIVSNEKKEVFHKIEDLSELEKFIKESKKPVLVDVWAKWCVSCKELEEVTFSDPSVQKEFQRFVTLKLDVTDNSPSDKKFLKRFNLFGPPAILIFKDGKEVARIIGFKDPKNFIKILKEIR